MYPPNIPAHRAKHRAKPLASWSLHASVTRQERHQCECIHHCECIATVAQRDLGHLGTAADGMIVAVVASMRAVLLMLLPFLMPALASAQPGLQAPGSQGLAPRQHAVPPLPFSLGSPMPTLPPPQELGVEQPLPSSAGQFIKRPGFNAYVHDDGRILFDATYLYTGFASDPLPSAMASFDITDILSGLSNNSFDSYAHAKLELLHETFARRVLLRQAHNELTMNRAIADLPEYLNAVWNTPEWDPATKRQILFALWDECVEEGPEDLKQGGQRARRSIERFIVQTLPSQSQQGYSISELSALNQSRSSGARFAP